MHKFILIVAASLMGCQTTKETKTPTCHEIIGAQLKGCQALGTETIIAEDGIGISVYAACPDSQGEPILVMIGVADSPSLVASALKGGAKDIGWCDLGPVTRRVIRLEAPMPDMRASN